MNKVSVATFEKEMKGLRIKSCVLDIGVWEVKFYNWNTLYLTIFVMAESNKAARIEWNFEAADPAEASEIAKIKFAENPRLCETAERICRTIGEYNSVR